MMHFQLRSIFIFANLTLLLFLSVCFKVLLIAEAQELKMQMACGGCKYLRKRCSPDCILSPYFPGNNPQKFACVHKIYGASNFTSMLQKVPLNQRAIAAETLYQAANSRLKDPVHGCFGDFTSLSKQIYDAQSELAEVKAQITVLGGLNTQNVGKNVPGYGIPGLMEVPEAEGSKRGRNYEGVQQAPAGNWTAQVYLGAFESAEDAAMAYDVAALKLHGHRARLNFPYYEAVPHVSCDDSAQLVSSGGYGPSKRRCDSESAPGSVSTLLFQKEGFNQTSSQNYIPSSVWSDLSKLDSCLEHDTDSSMMSLLLAALDIPTQQTFGDRTPPKTELPYGSASQSTLNHIWSEDNILPWLHQETKNFIQATEGNVEDMKMERLCLRKGSPCQTRALQDGRSVHRDGSDLIVKVSYNGDIIKFDLSLSPTKRELEEKVAVRLSLSVGSFNVKYQDEEEEWILVACDEDLRTCMSTSRSFGNAAIRMMVVCR